MNIIELAKEAIKVANIIYKPDNIKRLSYVYALRGAGYYGCFNEKLWTRIIIKNEETGEFRFTGDCQYYCEHKNGIITVLKHKKYGGGVVLTLSLDGMVIDGPLSEYITDINNIDEEARISVKAKGVDMNIIRLAKEAFRIAPDMNKMEKRKEKDFTISDGFINLTAAKSTSGFYIRYENLFVSYFGDYELLPNTMKNTFKASIIKDKTKFNEVLNFDIEGNITGGTWKDHIQASNINDIDLDEELMFYLKLKDLI